MRVAYVCTDSGVPIFGSKGCSVHVQEQVRAFSAAGHDVSIFAARAGGKAPPDLSRIPVELLPRAECASADEKERQSFDANRLLKRQLIDAGPFDLIYERYSLWSFAAMQLAGFMGCPGLLEVNAPLIEEQATHRTLVNRELAVNVARRAFSAATAIIAVSDEIERYLNGFAEASGCTHVVPNGVDTARFNPDTPPTVPTANGTFTVGFVGSLKPWHGLRDLVEAFTLFHLATPNSRLLVVGDGPERANMARRVDRLGVSDAVVFAGAVPHDQVPGFISSMDVAVASYPLGARGYFSPLKLFEYMAAGVPVVATEIGQIADVVEHDHTGLLCQPGQPVAITRAIERLFDDSTLRQRLAFEARRYVVQNHTWESVTSSLLALAFQDSKTAAVA